MSTINKAILKLAQDNPEFRQALQTELKKQAIHKLHDQERLEAIAQEFLWVAQRGGMRGSKLPPGGLWVELQLTDLNNDWHYTVRLKNATPNIKSLTFEFKIEPLPGSSGRKVNMKSSVVLRNNKYVASKIWQTLKENTPQRGE